MGNLEIPHVTMLLPESHCLNVCSDYILEKERESKREKEIKSKKEREVHTLIQPYLQTVLSIPSSSFISPYATSIISMTL